MFHKILIANRGEIALRVIRTCREMGIRTVIAHSTADADSLPVRLADESVCIGPPEARASYLNIPSIISAAAITDSEAIHPGYGLLSENPAFAEICRACGITFIGPAPEAIRLMGDKAQAREMAKQAGAPVVPGSEGPVAGLDEAQGVADSIGYPVIVKAAAGGGGRGMRIVREREDLARAYATCQAEAGAAFGSSELYLEKYVEDARHVEVQVLGDKSGMRVHLGERDCSVQRRHQKLLEESPAPALPPDTRTGLYKAALAVANAVNYVSAGTVEFLVDRHGQFYFIEMNTRIQVEHPVTEMVTGLDIVREQIRIATGEPLGYKQGAVRFAGHSIE
ncbi:MAG TPA: biotin carboxylase N-terminal domain-containing protein, partial [Methylomirabilota bacterium]